MSRFTLFRVVFVIVVAARFAVAQPSDAPNPALEGVQWQPGPGSGRLGSEAQVNIPQGFIFAEERDTKTIMEATQNPVSGMEIGFISPEDGAWFVVFEFNPIGYVKDDEKAELDADAILASIRQSTAESNKERRSRGWETMEIVGWEMPPHYDTETHNLEWAIRGSSQGGESINFNTRLLGRRGVLSATLVSDPNSLQTILPNYKSIIGGVQYTQGSSYAEFTAGDKVAKYGLTALVLGGATAVAAKTGLLKALGKGIYFIVIAGVAVLGRVLQWFKNRFGSGNA